MTNKRQSGDWRSQGRPGAPACPSFARVDKAGLKTDPFTLATRMGHASRRTIMRYVQPDQHQQKEAMERYGAAMRKKRIRRVK